MGVLLPAARGQPGAPHPGPALVVRSQEAGSALHPVASVFPAAAPPLRIIPQRSSSWRSWQQPQGMKEHDTQGGAVLLASRSLRIVSVFMRFE